MAKDDTGRRAICGRCGLEIERHPPIWIDRGGNSHCKPGALHLAEGENVWTLLGKVAKRHVRAICQEQFSRSNLIGVRKMLNANARRGQRLSVGSTAPNVRPEEVEQLLDAIRVWQPRVTGELDEGGRKLLRSRRHAKRLAPVLPIIETLDHFRLIGFEWVDSLHCVPVYRAVSTSGDSFKFRNVPWQSGGEGPEILT